MTTKPSPAHPEYNPAEDVPTRFGDFLTRADVYGYPERPNVRRQPLGGHRL
jgi:hypothetical protein